VNSIANTQTNQIIGTIPIPFTRCPSDDADAVINGMAQTSYSGSLGSQATVSNEPACNIWYTRGIHYEDIPWNADHGNTWRKEDVSGIFGRMGFDGKMSFAAIIDGTSNVIMVGESLATCHDHLGWYDGAQNVGYAAGLWYFNGMGNAHAGTSTPINTMTTCATSQTDAIDKNYPFAVDCWEKHNWNFSWGFRSRHPAGSQFVFADGSVHFLSQNINYQTYQYLGGRRDGHAVNQDW
jgi:prepilin-type processing-associated H-X9-DG protein